MLHRNRVDATKGGGVRRKSVCENQPEGRQTRPFSNVITMRGSSEQSLSNEEEGMGMGKCG